MCMFILQNVIGQLSSLSACVGVSVFFVLSHFGDFFRHAQTIFNDDQVRLFSKQVAIIFHIMVQSMIDPSSVVGFPMIIMHF